MLGSVSFLLLVGWLAGKVATAMRLPPLLGMLFIGVLTGPYVFDVIAPELLFISQDLRTLTLIVILLRAGLGLKRDSLIQVSGPTLQLSLFPCLLEGLAVMVVSRLSFGFSWPEAGMLGFALAAVSPAVVIPAMLDLKEKGYGEDKHIATLILAGASLDDVFAITLFTAFLGFGTESKSNFFLQFATLPWNIGAGIVGGLALAFVLKKIYAMPALRSRHSEQLMLLLASTSLYVIVGDHWGIATLLGVIVVGFFLSEKSVAVAGRLANALAHIWLLAQIVLFTLVGAEVNVHVAFEAGLAGIAIITVGLLFRSIGVWLATSGTHLTKKERMFCVVAYTPKATVQAAIGALPLLAGVAVGDTILAIAVLSIVFTAPLGAWGIQFTARRWLNRVS